jgi:hypothetical protein
MPCALSTNQISVALFASYQETFFRMSSFTARANRSAAITAHVSSESEKLLLDGLDLSVDIGTFSAAITIVYLLHRHYTH